MIVNPRVQAIAELVNKLTEEDQEKLFRELKKQVLLAQARQLDASVKPNRISMDEIVAIVREVRQTRPPIHAVA
ncbi:MAG: hypothetical protein AAB316_18765 [Bacteroidota bacterium]